MVSERQRSESGPPSLAGPVPAESILPPSYEDVKSNGSRSSGSHGSGGVHTQKAMYFLAEVRAS